MPGKSRTLPPKDPSRSPVSASRWRLTKIILASLLADRLKSSQRFAKVQRYAAGLVYIGLGLTTAFSGSTNKS